MKISTRRSANDVRLKDLQTGEIFRYGQAYGMRIRELMNEEETPVCAIDLADGFPLYIGLSEIITRIDAELMVS